MTRLFESSKNIGRDNSADYITDMLNVLSTAYEFKEKQEDWETQCWLQLCMSFLSQSSSRQAKLKSSITLKPLF